MMIRKGNKGDGCGLFEANNPHLRGDTEEDYEIPRSPWCSDTSQTQSGSRVYLEGFRTPVLDMEQASSADLLNCVPTYIVCILNRLVTALYYKYIKRYQIIYSRLDTVMLNPTIS